MTVSTTNTRDQFTGDGVTASLPTTFAFNASSEIKVTSRVILTGVETVLTITTHYTVTGGEYETGTITIVDPATDFPNTVEWTVERVTPLTQETDWVENANFSAESHERSADKLTMIAQERNDRAERALRAPSSDDAALDMELPNSVDRASTYLAFDADGEPIASTGSAGGVTVSTWIEDNLLDDTSAAVARATLNAQEDVGIGADGTVLSSDGADAVWAAPTFIGIDGFDLTIDGVDAELLDCSAGRCSDSGGDVLMVASSVLTRTPDATWVVGGPGGAAVGMSAAWAALDQLHVFILSEDDGTNCHIGFDEEIDADNLINNTPNIATEGLVLYRRIGTIHRVGASQDIEGFKQLGNWTIFLDPFDTTEDATITNSRSSWIQVATPNDVEAIGLFNIFTDDASDNGVYISAPGMADLVPDIASAITTVVPHEGGDADAIISGNAMLPVFLDSGTPSIGVRAATAALYNFAYTLLGYYQPLGRS
jgi:hypothetical protein